MKQVGLFVLVALVGLMVGAGYALMTRSTPPQPGVDGASVGDPRPFFRHADLAGQWVEVDQFDGELMLVNFWATWCAPCRREMPVLQQASDRLGDRLTVVGIAMDEPLPVTDFVADLGIEYPVLVGTADVMQTQRAWGNASGALPYTVLVDREGLIRWQHLGEVTADELDTVLADWL